MIFRLENLICIILFGLSLFSCTRKTSNSEYRKIYTYNSDSIFTYLVSNSDTIANYVFLNRNSELELFDSEINKSILGWSCKYKVDVGKNIAFIENTMNQKYAELFFLYKIIESENLKKGSEIDLVKYWKQINNQFGEDGRIHFITNIDIDWELNMDGFSNNILEKYDSNQNHSLNIDSCEKDAYIEILNEISRKSNNTFFMSIDLIISENTIVNSNAYFNRHFKRLNISYDKNNEIVVDIKYYLNYR